MDVKEKHGYWKPVDAFGGYARKFACSECGLTIEPGGWTTPRLVDVPVCPMCGSQMDKKVDNDG